MITIKLQICKSVLPQNFSRTVPFNYNFILHTWHHAVFCMLNAKVSRGKYYLHVTGHGISTRRDVEFPQDKSYNLHETWSTKWHPRKNHDNYYYSVPRECSYLQLKPVSEYPVYTHFRMAQSIVYNVSVSI